MSRAEYVTVRGHGLRGDTALTPGQAKAVVRHKLTELFPHETASEIARLANSELRRAGRNPGTPLRVAGTRLTIVFSG